MNLNYKTIPNYPKDGINFIDMHDLYLNNLITICGDLEDNMFDCDAIVAVGSRGWITGSILAYNVNKPLFLARDESKALPGWIKTEPFDNEYAPRRLCIDPKIRYYSRVIIVDDLIATGNTLIAMENLLLDKGLNVVQLLATIKLKEFNPHFKSNLYYCQEI